MHVPKGRSCGYRMCLDYVVNKSGDGRKGRCTTSTAFKVATDSSAIDLARSLSKGLGRIPNHAIIQVVNHILQRRQVRTSYNPALCCSSIGISSETATKCSNLECSDLDCDNCLDFAVWVSGVRVGRTNGGASSTTSVTGW